MSRLLAAEVASTKVDKTDHGIVQAMRQQFDHVDDEGPGGCETGAHFHAYIGADTRAIAIIQEAAPAPRFMSEPHRQSLD